MIVKLKRKYGKDSINFSLNILRFPSFQSVLTLPRDIRIQFAQELKQFGNAAHDEMHEFERNQLARLLDYLHTPDQDPQVMQVVQHDFKLFYQQYDQRRSKDFKYTFPQLADWYDTL